MYFLESLLYTLPGIIIGFTLHEFGHAYMAHRLGDPTPDRDGRLTLSPFAHIDPLGLLLIALVGFGWAKPVRITPRYFSNPKRDELLVALAGPIMNLFLVIFFIFLLRLLQFNFISIVGFSNLTILSKLFYSGALINAVLLFFNLLPLFPLDGYSILANLVPYSAQPKIYFLRNYGTIILIALIVFRAPLNLLIMKPAEQTIALVSRALFIFIR